MGSYNETIVGRGKNKKEALREAWDQYVFENGHRCSLRETESAKKLRDVPPIKPMSEMKRVRNAFGRVETVEFVSSKEDPSAPKSEWLEEWEFEVWVHS